MGLDELKVKCPRITVMNKCEDITDFSIYPNNAEFISAKCGIGLESLLRRISSFFASRYQKLKFELPYSELQNYFALQKYVESGEIIYESDRIKIMVLIAKIHLDKFGELYSKRL